MELVKAYLTMLPTNTEAPLCLSAGKLNIFLGEQPVVERLEFHHLYFYTNEKIERGDWVYDMYPEGSYIRKCNEL